MMYLRTAVVISWIGMTAWLIRFEACPELFTHSISGYKGLLSKDILISDSWMKIMFRGSDIGYSHSSMDINEKDSLEHYIINNRVQIAFNISGNRRNIHVISSIILDIEHNLRKFSFSMSSPLSTLKVEGIRTNENNYNVVITTPSGPGNSIVKIPDDVLIYSPVSDTALKQLKPGQQVALNTIDPVSLRRTSILFRGLRREIITVSAEQIETTVIAAEYHGIEILSWLDSNGNMVRQDTQIGLSMQRCSAEEAYDATLNPNSPDELLKNIMPLFLFQEQTND